MKRGLLIFCALLALGGGVIHRLVNAKRTSGWRALHETTARAAQAGSLQGLLRARMGAVRLATADADEPTLLAELAFINAQLAHHYGLTTGAETAALLQRLGASAEAGATAARALLALDTGDWSAAESLARAAATQDPHDVRSLLVLVRLQTRAGDLAAASQAAESAAVMAPEATAAQVEWAEARLDLGQPQAALDVLREVVARAPDQTRARLLIEEARQALDGPAAETGESRASDAEAAALAQGCRRDGAISPVIEAGCLVGAALAARLRGDRKAALEQGLGAAAIPIDDPRTLARTAWLLAELGQIDRAHDLVARAARRARARMPSLAWARVALALGRGQAAPRTPQPHAAHPETVLIAARAAFAAAGAAALARALADAGAAARARDPDLAALASLADPGSAVVDDPAHPGPVLAYAIGMRARLRGDLDRAANFLGQALADHGDACRAAGEYLVVMRLLRRPVEHQLEPLQAVNHDCLNLALPPPRRDPHVIDPRHDTGVRRPKH
jgi:hypothetical protein